MSIINEEGGAGADHITEFSENLKTCIGQWGTITGML